MAKKVIQNSPFSLLNCLQLVINHFAIIFLLFLCLLGGFLSGAVYTENRMLIGERAGTAGQPTPNGSPDPLAAIPAPTKDDFYQGNVDAKVVLVEYADFECTYCAQFEPTLDRVTQEYGDKIGRVYRHLPVSIHPHAEQAAQASECVAAQKGNEGFWEFAKAIFDENTQQGQITPDSITAAAQAAGVDMTQYQTCLSSGQMAAKVNAQQAAATAAGISGTPATVIFTKTGQRFLMNGTVEYPALKTYLDSLL